MDIGSKYSHILNSSSCIRKITQALSKIDNEKCYITGGALRNIVWNYLHRYAEEYHLDDFDVIFFNEKNTEKSYENCIKEKLINICPDIRWSVKNQARMYHRNNHVPYRSIYDALIHFPETSSAIAIDGECNIIAPFGFRDLIELKLKPTTFCRENELSVFYQRLQVKGWIKKWDQLTTD